MSIATSNSFDQKIAESKLRLLKEQNAVTFLTSNIGVPTVITLLLYFIGKASAELLIIWLLSGYIVGLLRALHHRKLLGFESSDRPIRTWENELVVLSALSGFFWSALGIMFMDADSPYLSMVLITAQLGALAGAVPALASHTKVFLAFVLCAWLPTGTYYFLQEDPFFFSIGILGSIFSCIVLSFSSSQRRTVNESLRLSHENVELLEELRIQKQLAEDANKAKSRFLAVASHDLRQPIHAMRLFSDSLLIRIKEESSLSIMHMLRSSIETLSGLFDSLLDISKLDAQAIEPQIHQIDVSQLIKNLSTEFSAQCFDKGLRCVYRCKSHLFVQSDPILLERILRNLIWNAIKYTSEGGILIAARKRGDQLRIEVWDTGCGIPADELPKIFEEFHQVYRPDDEAREGIGLGLSIVNRLCQLLEYQVSLRSHPDHGSVFFIEMPLSKTIESVESEAVTPEINSLTADTDLKGVNVLVVDDEEGIRNAMRHLLEDWGCKPMIVESDEQAIEALEEFTPDLILSDFHLRNSASGDHVIKLVNNIVGFDIPSIIITGDTSPEHLKLASSNCQVLMHKPLKAEELKKSMIRLLNAQVAPV